MSVKTQLTAEQQEVLNLMVSGAFSSIAVHFIGDNLAKGLHKAADATQRTTDVMARVAGTAQLCAIPAAKQAWNEFSGRFAKKTTVAPASS